MNHSTNKIEYYNVTSEKKKQAIKSNTLTVILLRSANDFKHIEH